MFGQSSQQQPAQPTTGAFGATTTSTGIFGQQQQPQPTTGREYPNVSSSNLVSSFPSLRKYPIAATTATTDWRSIWRPNGTFWKPTTEPTRPAESTWKWSLRPKTHHTRHGALRVDYHRCDPYSDGVVVWGWHLGTTSKPAGDRAYELVQAGDD